MDYGFDAHQQLQIKVKSPDQTRPAAFTIQSLGCGGGALPGIRDQAADGIPVNKILTSDHYARSWTGFQQPASDEVAINGVSLDPSDTLNATGGKQLLFTFKSANDFSMWTAMLQRQTKTGGTVWEAERTIPFLTETIKRGQRVSKSCGREK